MNTKELSGRADVVIRARVVSQKVVRREGQLWTDSKVQVKEGIKGQLKVGSVAVIRQPGGETPKVGVKVAGAAQLRPKEEVLLFIRRVGSYYVPVGMCLGKYQIYRDPKGTLRARRDLHRVSFIFPDPTGRFILAPAGAPDVPLESLLRAVRKGGGR